MANELTTGLAIYSPNSGNIVSFPSHSSFENLTSATIYLVVYLESRVGGTENMLVWKSGVATTNFANRSVSIDTAGKLKALSGRSIVDQISSDAELFPIGVWMQIAATFISGVNRIWKAPLGQPLMEVRYGFKGGGLGAYGPGNGFSTDTNRPWIVGDQENTGIPSKARIQHFRYYNQAFENGGIQRRQYDFQPTPLCVFSADFGRYASGKIVEQVGANGVSSNGTITGAVERRGIVLGRPPGAPLFATGAGGGGGATIAAFLQHFRNIRAA